MVQSINNSSLTLGLLANLNKAQDGGNTALERIGSGKQINSAADNAAGLAIVERFISQLSGFEQSARNASDGISFTQVAEAGLSSITEDLQRIRELSVQAANGSLADSDRASIQAEVSQLQQEIGRRLETTEFNGVAVFQSDASIAFQVGGQQGDTIDLTIEDISDDFAGVATIDVSTQSSAQDALSVVNDALETVADQSVNFGAVQSRLASSISNTQNTIINTEAARSRIEDADVGKSVSELIKSQIQQQSGIAVQAQANSNAQLTLRLLQ